MRKRLNKRIKRKAKYEEEVKERKNGMQVRKREEEDE